MVHMDIGATGTTDTMEKTTNAEFDAVVTSETPAIQPRHLLEDDRVPPAQGRGHAELSPCPREIHGNRPNPMAR